MQNVAQLAIRRHDRTARFVSRHERRLNVCPMSLPAVRIRTTERRGIDADERRARR
jgi:hypothetical protein